MPTISRSPDQRRRSIGRALSLGAAALVAGAGSFAVVRAADRPQAARISTVQDVPSDVAAEIDATWRRFERHFAGRMTCIDDVSVELLSAVDGGDARYVTGEARIEIEIPTTPARFRESLAHELAHHLEWTCPEFGELRDRLHPMLGIELDWSGDDIWYERPSERFAEHVAELVNGSRVRHVDEIPLDREVTTAVVAWGVSRPAR